MFQIRHSSLQHYTTLFNPVTGFFMRIEDPGYEEPKYSHCGPELIDIAVTNWCDRGCSTCYRSSGPSGQHMEIALYRSILRQAARLGVMQVALGGGNPNQHPDFAELLRFAREDCRVVPSYTTNGRGLTEAVVQASKRHCGAVAVSAYEPYEREFADAVRLLVQSGVRTNVHFVLTAQTINIALEWLSSSPVILDGINALVFLNYKPVGRTNPLTNLLSSSRQLRKFFDALYATNQGFRIGFDSCLVPGLVSFTKVNSNSFDACDGARFSMFISETGHALPCSFMTPLYEGEKIDDTNLQQVWQTSPIFVAFRRTLLHPKCACLHVAECMGGCPIFDDIKICRPDAPPANHGCKPFR